MTVSIAVVHNPDYYQDDLEDSIDYYIGSDAEARSKPDAPRWVGGLAKELGLEGKLMTAEDSLYLLNGFDPRCRIPPGASLLEQIEKKQLVPLRKSADAEALGMSLLTRDMRLIRKAEKTRELTRTEIDYLREGSAVLKVWNGKLKETQELVKEHDILMAGKRAGKIWDEETQSFLVYGKSHEARREKLGKDLASMPGGQRQAVDFTFSLCKEMSIVYARATDDEKELMRAAFQEETSAVVNSRLNAHAQTRDFSGVKRGENPKVIRAAGMASVIVHDTTRVVKEGTELKDDADMAGGEGAQQAVGEKVLKGKAPGLHGHAVAINITVDEKGMHRSLSTEELEDMRKEMDAEFHARVLERFNGLRNAAGERFCAFDAGTPHGKAVVGIAAPGVDRADVESMSGRALAIQSLKDKAAQDGKKVDYSYGKLETREAKDQDADVAETYKAWAEHLDSRGLTREKLGMGAEGIKEQQAVDEARAARRRALAAAPMVTDFKLLDELCAHKTTFTPSELRQALWVDAIGHGDFSIDARMERILNNRVLAIEADAAKMTALVADGKMTESKKGERVFVLSQSIREELEFDKVVGRMGVGGAQAATPEQAKSIILKTESKRQAAQVAAGQKATFAWRDDQKDVIEAILTSDARLMVVKAPPGSGKTTALSAVVAFAKEEGIDHVILAPSWKAVGGAKKDAQMEMGYAIQGFVNDKEALKKIKKGTMIFVDESSMVDMPDMLKLAQEVEARGGRIVLFGDTKQLAAVGRGDPMARVQEIAPGVVCDLTEITRQKDEGEKHRQFIKAQYEGRHQDFVRGMEEQGVIATFDTLEAKQKAFVDFFFSKDCKLEEKEMLAGTNSDCAALNAMIRKRLIEDGTLGKEGASLICETAGGESSQREFRVGDRMLFVKGIVDEKAGLDERGKPSALVDTSDTGTVLSVKVAEDGKSVHFKVAVDGKGVVEFDSRAGARLDHAYVMTTHRSQGMTVDLCGYFFNAMSGAESLLVGVSRHRYSFKMFCLEKERESLEAAAGNKTEKVRGRDLAWASESLMGANAALAKLARQFGGAQFAASRPDGGDAIERFFARAAAITSKLDLQGARALRAYVETRLERIKVERKVETPEDAAIKRLLAKAQAGIDSYKAIEVPFGERKRAKAAGAVWMPDRGAWVAPPEREAELLSMFKERSLVVGTRSYPASAKSLAALEGTIEGVSGDRKSLLLWTAQGACVAIPMDSPLLKATAKGDAWSHSESFGARLGKLQGAAVAIDLQGGLAVKVSILSKGQSCDWTINEHGRLDGRVDGAAITLDRRGLAATVGLNEAELRAQYKADSADRHHKRLEAAKSQRSQALAERLQDSIVLAVPHGEAGLARKAGADYDAAADVWHAPKGADMAHLGQWEALQVPLAFKVPYEDSQNLSRAKIKGVRWSKDERAYVAEPGVALAMVAKYLPGPEMPGLDKLGRPLLNVPFADREWAKSLGVQWDHDLRASVGPKDLPKEWVKLWQAPSMAPDGTRAKPFTETDLTARLTGQAEHRSQDGAIAWHDARQGKHFALNGAEGLLAAKAPGWTQSFGEKMVDHGWAGVQFSLDIIQGKAVGASVEHQGRSAYFKLDERGQLAAVDGQGRALDTANRDLAAIVGLDPKQLEAAAMNAAEAGRAQRAAMSTILAVPPHEVASARAAGARLDYDNRVWHIPEGVSSESFSRWACSQERAPLHVPSHQTEQARQAGARQDAETKAWYAPIGSTPGQLAAMSAWGKELEQVRVDVQAPKSADQSRAEQLAQVERALAAGTLGDWKHPVPLQSLPDRFFDAQGQVAATYVGSRVSQATGQEYAVMKVSAAGKDVFFGAKVGSHEIKDDIRELDAAARMNRPHSLWVKREPTGALGWVEMQGRAIAPSDEARRTALEGAARAPQARPLGEAKVSPSTPSSSVRAKEDQADAAEKARAARQPMESARDRPKTGLLAKAASAAAILGAAVAKAVGVESQEAIQARLRAEGEAVLKERAAREAASNAKAELDKGRDIIDAVHGAAHNIRRDREIARQFWTEAVEKIAQGGFDPKAQWAGSTLLHHMAEIAPRMETVLLNNGSTMDAQTVFGIVSAKAGANAMATPNANGQTPTELLAKAQQHEAEDKAKWAEALKGIDAGLSARKPIAAESIPDGKILDGTVFKVDHETLIFQAKEGKNTTFYQLPRAGLFGNREEFGLEVSAKSRPIKLQMEAGVATRAFIVNSAAKDDAAAPKEIAVTRASGRFHIEGTQESVSRADVLARTSSRDLERQRQLEQKRVASQGRGAQSI
jgi:hypothetical protein